jgi:D-tyrosyl-tRNA(Tyr) deacylase
VIAVIQRVTSATVDVADERIATIGRGILALVAVEKGDREAQVGRLAERLLGYRIFPDAEGRMNRNLPEISGELLLVSQFTLAADTAKGRRPSFTPAAEPALGAALFEALVGECRRQLHAGSVACGRFGADMQVSLVNDGPVTFILKAPPDPPHSH